MSILKRMKICRIIDRMESNPELSKRLGLANKSTFHGDYIDKQYENVKILNGIINKGL